MCKKDCVGLDCSGLFGENQASRHGLEQDGPVFRLDESFWQKELRKQNLHPTEYTRKLAEAKAHSAAVAQAGSVKGGTVFYLGSDTVVDIDDRILEKPVDTKEAKAMITRLSGRKVIFL